MAGRRPGPDPKGKRTQVSLRPPTDHVEVYRQRAHDAGYPTLNDYLVAQLAHVHDLPEPHWTRPQQSDRLELPMGA